MYGTELARLPFLVSLSILLSCWERKTSFLRSKQTDLACTNSFEDRQSGVVVVSFLCRSNCPISATRFSVVGQTNKTIASDSYWYTRLLLLLLFYFRNIYIVFPSMYTYIRGPSAIISINNGKLLSRVTTISQTDLNWSRPCVLHIAFFFFYYSFFLFFDLAPYSGRVI